jgi:CheY-like chemotaxis protein
VEEIRKAGHKASSLTQQLLAFSRKQACLPKPMDLNQVVRDMEKMLRRALTGSIDLSTVLAEGLPLVISDAGQIGQVIMNLVLNARDALPKGGRITITTFPARLTGEEDHLLLPPGPGHYSALLVEDDGVGIGPEIRGRLFEPFFSTKESGKGTGLGLSTVHGIVKQNGGGIGLCSQPRRGAAFTIYFPQAQGSPGEEGKAGNRQGRARSGAATILVVEDEEPVRRLVSGILAGEGHRVIEADGGSAALRAFATCGQGVDLVLSDIIMPGMTGRELVQSLQATRPCLKVIFMSGYIDDEAFVEGLGSGSAPFLAKPFSPAELAAKVREVLEAELARLPDPPA